MEEQIKEKIVNAMWKNWIESNPELEKDMMELVAKDVWFNTKYGATINAKDLLVNPPVQE